MSRIHPNNFVTTLAANLDDTDTTVTLSDNIPTLAAGERIRLTVFFGGDYEIFEIDDNTGAPTYNIAGGLSGRGLEGTVAANWLATYPVECRFTQDSVDTKQDNLDGYDPGTITPTVDDWVLVQDESDSDKFKRVPASDILALASASAMSLITSKTASGSSSLDFTDLPDCAKILFVLADILPATDNANLQIRTSSGTGGTPTFDTGGTDYGYGLHGFSTASHAASASASNSSILTMASGAGLGISNAAGETCNGDISLYNPLGSGYSFFRGTLGYMNQDALPAVYDFTGVRKDAAACRAVRFFMSSGNIASGTIYAYAISKT